jgi:hypothetical protein
MVDAPWELTRSRRSIEVRVAPTPATGARGVRAIVCPAAWAFLAEVLAWTARGSAPTTKRVQLEPGPSPAAGAAAAAAA